MFSMLINLASTITFYFKFCMVFYKFVIIGPYLLSAVVWWQHIVIQILFNISMMGSYFFLKPDVVEDHENKRRLPEEEGHEAKK